jgi:hypothetical protein
VVLIRMAQQLNILVIFFLSTYNTNRWAQTSMQLSMPPMVSTSQLNNPVLELTAPYRSAPHGGLENDRCVKQWDSNTQVSRAFELSDLCLTYLMA